ncbi:MULTISPECIES: arsenate reductase/protein-tyrosine-phosphatase family protein [Tenebrionibacter/Tenebrionicola group]|jgi:protein-tyrosine phosphatase|uniref:protein-tyrosine-phosphatase n=2 Tax=Tenebrionibacter/Tenebrionicola group TaxID=2969848 RepID=A0A8K0XYJ3_9ENTR|nr:MULTISPECIES: protein tyrosine phosphatase [Tenebrionibacter/Tenebrionicola group]MBK4714619.1 protein tyrosine phosphatase [Tenebrionibacter intestinalis]MBV5095073.1 protein tyrosine phosphatase [Tenebrionicola larvae]
MGQLNIRSVLVVCMGNICRSPFGAALLRQKQGDLHIESAGIHALVGHPADKMASSLAERHGLKLNEHRAKQLTAQQCRDTDLILVMEKQHVEHITYIAPEVRGKTMLMGHWLQRTEIADPYKKSTSFYEFVYGQMDQAVERWANVLSR